jgi:hypothetical protein
MLTNGQYCLPQVEQYYITNGWLLPDFYQNWWIGLNKNSSGSWVWTDGLALGGAPDAPGCGGLSACSISHMHSA